MKNKFIFSVTFIICVFNLVQAYSDTIKISSKLVNVYRENSVSVFSGQVYAEDNEIKLWSDKLSVYYDESKNSVYKIVAEENVKIIAEGVTAYGNYSEYQIDNEELLLEGNVAVIENDNQILSDQLILDLAKSTSIMTAKTNNRVKAQISKTNNE